MYISEYMMEQSAALHAVCPAEGGRRALPSVRHTADTGCVDEKRAGQGAGDGSKIYVGAMCVQ
jgi:hypothetical protein